MSAVVPRYVLVMTSNVDTDSIVVNVYIALSWSRDRSGVPPRQPAHGAPQRAWEVVDAEGVDALSLRQLARDIGVSHGASARHFRDRQALLDALAVEGFRG